MAGGRTGTGWVAVAGAVAARPDLWATALRQSRRLAGGRRRGLARLLPDPSYLRFRLLTQYGDAGARSEPADVVAYLTWVRRWQDVAR